MSDLPTKQHFLSNGKPMSSFELFIVWRKGTKDKPTATYRGDATLEFYRNRCNFKTITTQSEALFKKLSNIADVEKATIYDNRGETPRVKVFELEYGEVKINLLKVLTV